jgi:hypothetical protein
MTNSCHRDNFKMFTNANTDGIIKCLLQPGHVRNQLFTSMLATSFRLLNFVYPDSSCCRDKVSRAAGRRSVSSVFCSPFIKFTVTSKWRFHYRDSYVREFYRDGTTSRHLPGLAKNSPTPTQTAPNYTTEPLWLMIEFLHIRQLSNTNHNKKRNLFRDYSRPSIQTSYLDEFNLMRSVLPFYRD